MSDGTDVAAVEQRGVTVVESACRGEGFASVDPQDIVVSGGSQDDASMVEQPDINVVSVGGAGDAVCVDHGEITVVAVGEQGPQGPPGISSDGGTIVAYPVETPLATLRMTAMGASGALVYADSTNLDHVHAVFGMTLAAGDAATDAVIITRGMVSDPSWVWVPGVPVWLGTNGEFTQTPPITGFILIVGFPVSTTKLFINIREPIVLI